MSNSFGIKSFSDFISKDFYRPYRFKVIFDNPTFIAEWISSSQTPVSTTSVQNIDFMHSQIKVDGKTTCQLWNVTVRDVIGRKESFNYFKEWRDQVYNPEEPSYNGSASRFKRTALVSLLPSSTSDAPSQRIYKLFGVWPIEIGATQLDYENSSGIVLFPVTLCLDYYTIEYGVDLENYLSELF